MAENDFLGEKLQSILSNPESLKSIMQIASGLGFGMGEKQDAVPPEKKESITDESQVPILLENQKQVLSTGIKKSVYSDDRMNLLLSIKPFLNDKKRQRIDSVIKAMQAAKIINAYKDSDLFSSFGIK